MKGDADIIASPGNVCSQQARDVRARAWAFVFESWRAKQEAACPGGPDDAEDLENDRTASENYTE